MSASPCAVLSDNLLRLNSSEWDECRLKELGVSGLNYDSSVQENIFRAAVVRHISNISVKEFLRHFQGRGKPICDLEEENILHLDSNYVEQKNKLGQVLIGLSKVNESFLRILLLSLMDAYEEFNGGKSTHGHWTLVSNLLDEVRSVDHLPKYILPDIYKDQIPLAGAEFNGTTALALVESLGVEHEQFNSYEQICQKWIGTSSNCTFSRLVEVLLLTRGLGRLVTNLCPPSKSNPPAVLTWFNSLCDGEWKKVATFVGLEAEMKLIENKHYSHAVALRMFLRCLRIPDCDASALNNILDLMAKHMKVKIKSANEVMNKAAPQQGFHPVNEAVLLSAYRVLTSMQPQPHDEHSFRAICEDDEVYKDSARPQVHQPNDEHSVRAICEDDEVYRDSARPQVQQMTTISDESRKNQSPPELDSSQLTSGELCDRSIAETTEQDTPRQQALQLLQACENKEWDTAKLMLQTRQTDDKLLEVCNQDNGMTALHYVCEKGIMELVDLLLNQGADATRLTARGSSVLCYPKVLRSEELLERLLVEFQRKNCSVDLSENKDLVTPLMVVCHEGDTLYHSAELLLNSGASPDGPQKASSHPLIIASEGGHLRLVKLLVGKQLNLNLQDKRGNTALLQACRYRYFSIADFLLEQPGVNIDRSDKSGTTPLFEAISSNNYSFTKKLLEKKARVNIIRHVSNAQMSGSVEETPLSHACAKGFLDLVTLLIDNEADVNYICCGNVPPIAFAIICRQEKVIEKLLACDRLDSTISGLSSPIIYAVRVENYRCAQRLIDRLGGNEKALREASLLQLDHLVTHIKMLESVDPQKVSAQEMALKQQEVMSQKNIGSVPSGDVDATLDRFCHLCVQVLREYEDRKQVSLKDLADTAKAISGNPDIAEFLLSVASHDKMKFGGLRKQFLYGRPSPLTFLTFQQPIITPEDFFEQAFRYFQDEPDDFYSQLVGAFHTIQHSERLPYDIQGILNHLCSGQFQINLQVAYSGADSFPPDHTLPEEFRTVTKATIPVPSTGQYLQPAGDGFPTNSSLPKEFQTKEFSAGDDVTPCEYSQQPKSHCTYGAANCTANGNGWQPQCVNGSKLNPSSIHPFQGTGHTLGSSPSVSQPPEKQKDHCELTFTKQKELQLQLKVGQQSPPPRASSSSDVLSDSVTGLRSCAYQQEQGLVSPITPLGVSASSHNNDESSTKFEHSDVPSESVASSSSEAHSQRQKSPTILHSQLDTVTKEKRSQFGVQRQEGVSLQSSPSLSTDLGPETPIEEREFWSNGTSETPISASIGKVLEPKDQLPDYHQRRCTVKQDYHAPEPEQVTHNKRKNTCLLSSPGAVRDVGSPKQEQKKEASESAEHVSSNPKPGMKNNPRTSRIPVPVFPSSRAACKDTSSKSTRRPVYKKLTSAPAGKKSEQVKLPEKSKSEEKAEYEEIIELSMDLSEAPSGYFLNIVHQLHTTYSHFTIKILCGDKIIGHPTTYFKTTNTKEKHCTLFDNIFKGIQDDHPELIECEIDVIIYGKPTFREC